MCQKGVNGSKEAIKEPAQKRKAGREKVTLKGRKEGRTEGKEGGTSFVSAAPRPCAHPSAQIAPILRQVCCCVCVCLVCMMAYVIVGSRKGTEGTNERKERRKREVKGRYSHLGPSFVGTCRPVRYPTSQGKASSQGAAVPWQKKKQVCPQDRRVDYRCTELCFTGKREGGGGGIYLPP
jgi:hypothetical protein